MKELETVRERNGRGNAEGQKGIFLKKYSMKMRKNYVEEESWKF
jgi:hypothetical protein